MARRNIGSRLQAYKPSNVTIEEWQQHITEIAPVLGHFIIAFNELDAEVTDFIIELSGIKNDNQFKILVPVISKGSFFDRIRVLRQCLSIWMAKSPERDKMTGKMNDIFKALEGIAQTRNSYVHADWHDMEVIEGEINVKVNKLRFDKNDLFHEYLNCTVEKIEAFTKEIEKTLDDLEVFIDSLSPKK